MSAPAELFRPFTRLVQISILGKVCEVPEGNTLLRGMQYLAPESISMGRFCWNEDCQYCRVAYDLGQGTPARTALACKLQVADGLRVLEVTPEIRYCLRSMKLGSPS